jgi:hypothetical protein
MNARRLDVLLIATILCGSSLLAGQAGGAQENTPVPPSENRANLPEPAPFPTPPPPPANPGAGAVVPPVQGYVPVPPATPGVLTPPNQGYVDSPTSAPAGNVTGSAIPADPLDRAYWEMYDRARSVTLTGRVTRVDWSNPNTYIYVSSRGATWALESNFTQFRQASVTPAVRVGDTVTVVAYLPRDEKNAELPARTSPAASYLKNHRLGRAGEITTAYGQRLSMGIPPTDKERADRLRCTAFGC